jgi:hypothetical protein
VGRKKSSVPVDLLDALWLFPRDWQHWHATAIEVPPR